MGHVTGGNQVEIPNIPVNASTWRLIWCHNNQSYTLPSGGMWAYWYIGVREGPGDVYGVAAGVVPGGTVLRGWGSNSPQGFCWKVSD